MKLRTIILKKNREVLIKKIKPHWDRVKYKKGLYVIDAKSINNYEISGKIKGSEIIYFEDNPNPVKSILRKGKKGDKPGKTPQDESAKFLNQYLIRNTLEQTSEGPKVQVGEIFDKLTFLKDPSTLVYFLFFSVIVYGILKGGGYI